jgi:short-subunit dehydrogenase
MPADLSGARVLLTGATGGIGNAIARGLHGRGAHVLATGRRREALDELAGSLGDRLEPLVADLSERAAVADLVERAGRVDVLVANAALPGSGKLDSYSPEEIDRALEVNLRAPIQITRALAPAMVERGSGHVVLISSLSGKIPAAYSSIYSGTKFGLRGFGLSLNDELYNTGVGASIVAPGFIRDAGMFADSGVELPPGAGTRTPQDVADAVIRAIETGRQEIDVAPLSFRLGARMSGLAPGLMTGLQRRLGSHKVGEAMGEGQRSKR